MHRLTHPCFPPSILLFLYLLWLLRYNTSGRCVRLARAGCASGIRHSPGGRHGRRGSWGVWFLPGERPGSGMWGWPPRMCLCEGAWPRRTFFPWWAPQPRAVLRVVCRCLCACRAARCVACVGGRDPFCLLKMACGLIPTRHQGIPFPRPAEGPRFPRLPASATPKFHLMES